MKTRITSLKILILFVSYFTFTNLSTAQNEPFNCDFSAYLFQYNDVYALDLASGSSFLAAENITAGNVNAAAYNPADGYIWGYVSSPAKTIVRIGNDFSTTTYTIDALTTGNKYVGDISADGIYYFKAGGSTYYTIDLDPESATYTELTSTSTLSQNISIHDWAFNAVDNNLYAVEKGTNILYRINPANGEIRSLGEVPILSGLNYTYGAVYFDASGRFYVSANQTGTIYVIQNVQELDGVTTMDSNIFAFGPASSSNDGARCPTAPVLQEICGNGIDDDGDGLIDCEDPSCSGFGNCAVIDPETSGANRGGLESNNRLSDAILKRNYNRLKSNYKFDRKNAKKLKKTSTYGNRNPMSDIELENFIPLTLINEDYVIETSPVDLIEITNATDVYGVDYIRNEKAIASILALKTENGVYEHTKYICDRLLGAELISVSTIEINDQQFIKSLIRNIDGTIEFVLSFSAKVIANDSEFSIESHWNLDQYENNTEFYNFQIWSNSIDDLYTLGEELLRLVDVTKPITAYNNSTPPAVFVRKGTYLNGTLQLEIINTNATQDVTFSSVLRATETSDQEDYTTTIDLGGNYITNTTIDTGNLFDIGFRIGDGVATPDDLFLSDGPWGVDVAQTETTLENYEVTENINAFENDVFPIERNINLQATTSTYFSAYRALTARFQAVDLTQYNGLKLNASGTGSLQITLVKQEIENWEEQYKYTISLTETLEPFTIALESFTNGTGETIELQDLVTIVFSMTSEDGTVQTKEMNLEDIQFVNENILGTTDSEIAPAQKLMNYPNPFNGVTTIKLNQPSTSVQITVIDMLGRTVDTQNTTTQQNGMEATYTNTQLQPGVYNYIIIDNTSKQHNGRFIIK